MKKITRKFLAVIIAIGTLLLNSLTCLAFDSNTGNVYEDLKSEIDFKNYNLNQADINSILLTFSTDELFVSSFYENKPLALEIVDAAIKIEEKIQLSESANAIHPMGYIYYCYVDSTITQPNGSAWCGIASTLMALTGIESYDSQSLVSNYTRPTMSEIAAETIQSDSITPTVCNLTVYLNSKITRNKYTYKKIDSSTTKAQITDYIKNSLADNRPVLLHAKPYQAFNYYVEGGMSNTSGHYIVVEAYEPGNGMFTVSDCTYVTHNPPYQGRHYNITIDEIYNSLYSPGKITGRYIIYG